jgi:LmbE family N-acetylglucosaminyl deacetylase
MFQIMQETSRLIDITGQETLLILLASPGDELTKCGGLIGEACARGRPPFVVILGDGAADGSASLARDRERASRSACQRLGLPDERLLFVGLRQGVFPAIETSFFKALQAAMTELSWRRDCNVILAPFSAPATTPAGDALRTWQLARAMTDEIGLPLVASFQIATLPPFPARHIWRLDVRQWCNRKIEAGLTHGYQINNAGYEYYGKIA